MITGDQTVTQLSAGLLLFLGKAGVCMKMKKVKAQGNTVTQSANTAGIKRHVNSIMIEHLQDSANSL